MIPASTFKGKSVAVFGLGGSGRSVVRSLLAGGAEVAAWDDGEATRTALELEGLPLVDLTQADFSEFAALILSPGVPLTHPEPHWTVRKAQAAGIEIIGDIELFCRERAKIAPNAPFVAITGTNGKSTTTALIAHILREAGRDVQMGGNIGTAILSLAPPSDSRIHVIECSSFQIDLAPSLAPTIGVHLNLSPDHIDRHGTMELYAAIKERLVAKAGLAIVGVDDPMSRAIADACEARGVNVARVSVEPLSGKGVYADGETLVGVTGQDAAALANLSGIGSLRGEHNAQNAAAAVAVALAFDVSPEAIRSGLHSFPGLPHRIEEVGRIGETLFINDSKATNADSTEKALKSFDEIFWILGGKSKEGGIEPLTPYFPKIRRAYLIGASADQFAKTLGDAVPHVHSGTLDNAVAQAAQDAKASGARAVVLLSPACASYDQFPNYEVRGNHFRDLVRALPGIEARGA